MILAILYKKDKLEIHEGVYALYMQDGELTFNSSERATGCFTKPLDEVAKVSVNGIIYYDDGKARI